MADCVLRCVTLLVFFTLKNPVYSQWNFTVLDNDLLYSFYNCNCTDVNCSNNSQQLSTTATPLNTTESQTPISYQQCSCLNKTRECPDYTNSSSSNISTVWVHDSGTSKLFRCDISQPEPLCSNDSAIPEWIIQVNDTHIIFTDIFSNQSKFFNCSIAVADLNLDSKCNKTTAPSTTTRATTTTAAATTTSTTTSTAAAETGTTGLIITAAIAGVNILLGIGVCAFILCKRRQITVNYRKQQRIINKFSEATGTARTNTNNTTAARTDRTDTNSMENGDSDTTYVKRIASEATHTARKNTNDIEDEDRHKTFVKRIV